ncbi:Uncharacterised protein [uncultured archaeon]|nr:Uncharacterised protein [uncultured archaeon]
MYLGLNAYSHDSSACIIDTRGRIIAAAEEERFNQKKHFSGFPERAIKYCLKTAGISSCNLKGIAVGWDAHELLFDRILKEYLFEYRPPQHIFVKSVKKLWRLRRITKCFEERIGKLPQGMKIKYYPHYKAHAASAFYLSGFDDAAFLTIDARGEYDTSWWGKVDYAKGIQLKGTLHHPNSLGCIWGAIGEYCGFIPGWQKAGTTMAFAALGKPKYLGKLKEIVQFLPEKDNNWFFADTSYFCISDCKGQVTTKFEELIGSPCAKPSEYAQVHCDVAASWQEYNQQIILGKLNDIYNKTKKTKLVMAGGVCLNSVTNGLILQKTPFKELFIQPASHDAGVAIGAAYLLCQEFNKGKKPPQLNNALIGPEYSLLDIEMALKKYKHVLAFSKEKSVWKKTAKLLDQGEILMWFQGRLEFGPRALGSRSILAAAVNRSMIGKLNTIKQREQFRPFAISILEEKAKKWLVNGTKSPYMLLVDEIKKGFKRKVPAAQHVDGSVRVQTVNKKDNGIYYSLLKEYEKLSGIPLFINTSFNIKGLPIVNDPSQALQAFLNSKEVKYLVLGEYFVTKK